MEIALAEQGLFVLPAKVTQDQAKGKVLSSWAS
jgi:predicted RecA/RadA family phage recombinase